MIDDNLYKILSTLPVSNINNLLDTNTKFKQIRIFIKNKMQEVHNENQKKN